MLPDDVFLEFQVVCVDDRRGDQGCLVGASPFCQDIRTPPDLFLRRRLDSLLTLRFVTLLESSPFFCIPVREYMIVTFGTIFF